MVELTRKYIEDHMVGINTPESWAKQVSLDVLSAAIHELGGKSAHEVKLDAKFTVSPVEPPEGVVSAGSCIKVCLSIGSGPQRCYHINVYW
jgi:hypothetical protein